MSGVVFAVGRPEQCTRLAELNALLPGGATMHSQQRSRHPLWGGRACAGDATHQRTRTGIHRGTQPQRTGDQLIIGTDLC